MTNISAWKARFSCLLKPPEYSGGTFTYNQWASGSIVISDQESITP